MAVKRRIQLLEQPAKRCGAAQPAPQERRQSVDCRSTFKKQTLHELPQQASVKISSDVPDRRLQTT